RDALADANSHADARSDPHIKPGSDADAHHDAELHSAAEFQAYANSHADARSDPHIEPGSDADADPGADGAERGERRPGSERRSPHTVCGASVHHR
ncbi:MAG TPA: hypothetical protein VM253_11525, partial [Candidatus Limnocylindrales bacterium]|nr:hypothetical protein [Candidatus Limnocylindrales bacterium]